MEEGNNIIQFGAADIERYHKGLMNAKEMHALEKAAMDDPFVADALDGYQLSGVNTESDLTELTNRLRERTGEVKRIVPGKRSPYYFLRIAAMIVVVIGAGLFAYTFLNKNNAKNSLAKVETTQKTPEKTNSIDTISTLNNQSTSDSIGGNGTAIQKNENKAFLNADKIVAGEKKENLSFKYNNDTGKINVTVANTTRDAGEIASVTVKSQQKEIGKLTAQIKADESKKQLNEVVVLEKKEKALATEEFEVTKSLRSDNAFDKLSKRDQQNPAPSQNAEYKFKDLAYKKDTTNYSRLNIFRGRVTDIANNAIPFVNVTISDVNVGTYADANGNFSLIAPDTTLTVSLRAVGFNNSQIQLRNNLPTNQIILQEDKSLNAIVMNTAKPNANRSRSSSMVLIEPEPADGWENYDSYLTNNLDVPEESERAQKKGEVEVAFEVNSKGEPVNIKVTKSLCKECDEEAIRLVKEGPRWKRKSKKDKAKVTIKF